MKKMGKRLLSIALGAVMAVGTFGSALAKVELTGEVTDEVKAYSYWDTSLTNEERAADLISHMTLEEKISQLGSHPAAAIERLGVAEYWYPGENLNGIANISLWYGNEVGDTQSAASAFPSTLSQGSTWNNELIGRMADAIGDEARVFYNTSAKGLSHWGPSVNLARDPRWGRTGDSFGEDVLLSSNLGSEFVKGFQGDLDDVDGVLKAIACIKHFAANNAEMYRTSGSSNTSEAELHDFYLRHFENMVDDSNPASVMASYNAINGIPSHANYTLLTTILEKTWGFNGWVVSDNTGVENLNNTYGTAGSNAKPAEEQASGNFNAVDETTEGLNRQNFPVLDGSDAAFNGEENLNVNNMVEGISAAINAGVDLDLRANRAAWNMFNEYQAKLGDAVSQGLVTEDTINAALLDVLTTRFATGEFDNSGVYTEGYQSEAAFILANQDLAEEVANQAIVLLENNDNFLPATLSNYNTVAVVGQYTEELLYSDYKSNNEWRDANGVSVSFVKGIQDAVAEYNAANGTKIAVESIVLTESEDGQVSLPDDGQGGQKWNRLFTDAKTLTIYIPATRITMMSSGADAGEGNDRTTLALPRGQAELGEALCDVCPNIIVAMHTQSIVNVDCFKKADALLWASYLGEKQGAALANVLFGKVAPSGHLTTTWYADETQLGELQHDYTIYANEEEGDYGRTYMYFTGDVKYSFGYGLTYTNFSYANMKADKTEMTGDDHLTVTVDVTNNGSTAAYELVQLYAVGPNAAQQNRPMKQLAGYTKVYLEAGETKNVAVDVTVFDLSNWNTEKSAYEMDLGSYKFYLGTDCDHAIEGMETTVSCTADISDTLYAVVMEPDSYILEAGKTTATNGSVSLKDNTLYQTTAALPETITVTYASSNEAVATVAADGTVTAVAPGVCTITMTAALGEQTLAGTTPVVVK